MSSVCLLSGQILKVSDDSGAAENSVCVLKSLLWLQLMQNCIRFRSWNEQSFKEQRRRNPVTLRWAKIHKKASLKIWTWLVSTWVCCVSVLSLPSSPSLFRFKEMWSHRQNTGCQVSWCELPAASKKLIFSLAESKEKQEQAVWDGHVGTVVRDHCWGMVASWPNHWNIHQRLMVHSFIGGPCILESSHLLCSRKTQ